VYCFPSVINIISLAYKFSTKYSMLSFKKMSTVGHQNFASLSAKIRLRIFFTHHLIFTLSFINLICKIFVLTGLLITIFSSHWAKNPIGSNMYTGKKIFSCNSIYFL
jgi:hypothetical protein